LNLQSGTGFSEKAMLNEKAQSAMAVQPKPITL
jgi:hypothetical protein